MTRRVLLTMRVGAFLLAYIAGIATLMWLNVHVWCLGDAKLGCSGFELYFPLWAALYLPIALLGALLAVGERRWSTLFLLYLLLILAALEVSFSTDAHMPWLILEYGLLAGILVALRRSLRLDQGDIPRASARDA